MSPVPAPRTQEALTGPQKCAVLCTVLGTREAARILQQLSPDEVELVSREIAALGPVEPEVVTAVLKEYHQASQDVETTARGGLDYARQLLEQALGPARAQSCMAKIKEQVADRGLRRLRRTAPDVLAGILRGEHPQTVALILAHLAPEQATGVVRAMEPEPAAEALFRMARMEKIAPEVLALVEAGLGSKTDLTLSQEMTVSGGPAAVARLLNLAGQELEREMLDALGLRDAEVAGRVKALMFVFEDLLLVDGKGIQRVLREIETKDLALALKAASEELRQHIRVNMSERAAGALEEEMEILGPVRVRDVEAAHARIIESVRALEEAGEIMIRNRGGNDDIIE
jgi:flagellar motor switch protein FliG